MPLSPIAPCLWFPGNALEAVNNYLSIFPNSRIVHLDRTKTDESTPDDTVLFIDFELNGQPFQAINAEDIFPFTEAISLSIDCADQAEVDYYWDALIANGGAPSQCGWLKDPYGVSWQVVPHQLVDMYREGEPRRRAQAYQAMLTMSKLDVAALEAAYNAD